jgi:toxin ParE1/3/4
MKYDVVVLQRAEADVRHIVQWIADRSIQGANSWLDAYEELIDRLANDPNACPTAMENSDCQIALKQALFGTRHGQSYRAVFTIVGDQVRVLRLRGPGQLPIREDELW